MLTTLFGALHHVDHIVRGNHVGWPVTSAVSPFTYSLLVYPFLLTGLWLLVRRRITPLYWMLVGAAGFALVAWIHLGPDPAEPLTDIVRPYENGMVGALAVAILFALMISVLALTLVAMLSTWRKRRAMRS